MKKMYLMVIAVIGLMAGNLLAASAGDAALENTLLKQRLDQLDKEVQALRQSAGQQPAAAGTPARMPVWSSLDIQIYGYLKLDAAYDSSLIDTGNYAKWVESEGRKNSQDYRHAERRVPNGERQASNPRNYLDCKAGVNR